MVIEAEATNENKLNFDALCSPDQIARLEEAARGWGVNRRVAFTIAMKSCSELIDVMRNLGATDEDALYEMLDGIRGLIEYHHQCIELFDAVEVRCFIAAHYAFDVSFD